MPPPFKITKSEALKFSRVWTYSGIAIPMKDVHIEYATDFANVVLRDFIAMCEQNAAQARQQEVAKRLVLTDPT